MNKITKQNYIRENSWNELSHIVEHSKPKQYNFILCPGWLQPVHHYCIFRIQQHSGVYFAGRFN